MKSMAKKLFLMTAGYIFLVFPAFAGPPVPVPEPGMLPLFAIAGIALYIAKKRKK